MSNHKNETAWKKNFSDQAQDPMVLGVDIGGTKIHWATFRVVDGRVTHDIIAEDTIDTPKGPEQLVKAYSNIVHKAITSNPGYYLAGAGIASPGRFVEATDDARGLSQKTAARDWLTLQKSKLSMMGNGSAFNMWREAKPNDFDHVALESAFRRTTPRSIPVVVENDAAAQMQGFAYQLSQNGDRGKIEGKKLAYLAPGTGYGTAMRDKKGKVSAYGYFQEMALGQRSQNATDQRVFETIHTIALEKEAALPPKKKRIYSTQTTPLIQAEDLLCGTGIGKLLSSIIPKTVLPHDYKDRFDLRGFDAQYRKFMETGTCSIPNMPQAIDYLEATGRYLGDMMVKLHSGDYMPLDTEREMGKAYHDAAESYQTVLFGGGVSGAAFYRQIMVPQAEQVLQQAGIRDSIDIILPKNPDLEAAFAAACQIDAISLIRDPHEINARMDSEDWRTVIYNQKLPTTVYGR